MSMTIDGTAGLTFPDATAQPSAANPTGIAKAWVNANGGNGNTVGINRSFNVSSFSKTASNQYTISFTNPMPSANFVVTGCAARKSDGTGNPVNQSVVNIDASTVMVAGSVRIATTFNDGGGTDVGLLTVAVFA